MNSVLKVSLLLSVLAYSQASWAIPVANPKCIIPNLRHPIEGNGVVFSEDCTTAYVLPPKVGKAELKGLTWSTNLKLCPIVNKATEVGKRTMESAGIIAEKVREMIDDFDPLSEDLRELRTEVGLLRSYRDSAHDSLIQAQSHKESLEKYQLQELELSYQHFKNQYESKFQQLTELTRRYSESIKPLFELLNELQELNEKINSMYREYSFIEGTTGQIVFSTQWEKLLLDYRNMNRNRNVIWDKMPIKSASLWAYQKQDSSGETGIPALRWSRIPGSQTSEGTVDSRPAMTVFSSYVSGEIGLTLAGACPYFSNSNTRKRDVNPQELTSYLVANVTYTYELQARKAYHAKYQLAHLVSRLEKDKIKGGFFRTKHIHDLIEEDQPNDWFDIHFDADSGEFNYSPQEQAEISREVKAELIDRTLREISTLSSGQTTPPPLPFSVPTGMETVSNNLRQCPFFFCQAGSLILGGLESVVGGKETLLNFIKHNDTWASQDVNGIAIVDRSGTLTFQPNTK